MGEIEVFDLDRVACGGYAREYVPCLGAWAWENGLEKQDYISYPGEWELEGVRMNVVGKPK